MEGRAALQSARVIRQELAEIQTEVLDPANASLSNNDNPLSMDEIEGLTDQMDGIPEMVSATMAGNRFETPQNELASSLAESDAELSLDEISPMNTPAP